MRQDTDTSQCEKTLRKMVLVIGDIMLDQHIIGREKKQEGNSLFPVIARYEDRNQLAAAARIASIIKRMGVYVLLAGVVGKDEQGNIIKKMLKAEDIPLVLGMYGTRPTTVRKTISICDKPILSLEDGTSPDMRSSIFKEIIQLITILSDDLSTITICDYGRGVITRELVLAITQICKHKNIKTMVLIKNADNINSMVKYLGLQTIIINRTVIDQLHGDSLDKTGDLELAVKCLIEKTSCSVCIVVCGAEDIYLFKSDDSILNIPLRKSEHSVFAASADELVTAALAAVFSKNITIENGFKLACNAVTEYNKI